MKIQICGEGRARGGARRGQRVIIDFNCFLFLETREKIEETAGMPGGKKVMF